jgi:hypothetical protein
MLFFVTFCFAIDYIAALQCNRGQNYAVISSNCQRNVSYCSTVTYFDGNKTDNIVRDCDNDGYCSAFSIGNNQCRTEFNGAEMCCCSSDLCNSSPSPPLPTNCWSGKLSSIGWVLSHMRQGDKPIKRTDFGPSPD